jgi:hypothetical protein
VSIGHLLTACLGCPRQVTGPEPITASGCSGLQATLALPLNRPYGRSGWRRCAGSPEPVIVLSITQIPRLRKTVNKSFLRISPIGSRNVTISPFLRRLVVRLVQDLNHGLWDSAWQGVGFLNLLGVTCKDPEQVRDSDMSPTQTPKAPNHEREDHYACCM